jgi:hypothetical protein
MFNNIGAKIKGLAKFIFWVFAIIAIIGGMFIIIQGLGRSGGSAQDKIVSIIIGLVVIAVGIIMAWLQNFLLYGFGELVDSNQKILRVLEQRDIDNIVHQQSVQPQNTYVINGEDSQK